MFEVNELCKIVWQNSLPRSQPERQTLRHIRSLACSFHARPFGSIIPFFFLQPEKCKPLRIPRVYISKTKQQSKHSRLQMRLHLFFKFTTNN